MKLETKDQSSFTSEYRMKSHNEFPDVLRKIANGISKLNELSEVDGGAKVRLVALWELSRTEEEVVYAGLYERDQPTGSDET